jgi:thymidylate synthase
MNSDDYINIFVDPELRDEARKNKGNNGYTQKEFIEEIKIDPEFCKNWGDLGPIYGKQWRSWERYDKIGQHYSSVTQKIEESSVLERMPIDQIANLIRDLKSNPDSRRLMVNSWNCSDLDSMVLPPCHYSFQVYTRELSESERFRWYTEKIGSGMHHDHIVQEMDEAEVPKRAISLIWNQRSCDTFLGISFNIASYGLLLEILGKICNMAPDELIGNLGDTHLYLNHLEQAQEQISRTPYELPKLIHGKTDAFWKDFDVSLITHLDPSDFSLEGYISHPAIKAPLSN